MHKYRFEEVQKRFFSTNYYRAVHVNDEVDRFIFFVCGLTSNKKSFMRLFLNIDTQWVKSELLDWMKLLMIDVCACVSFYVLSFVLVVLPKKRLNRSQNKMRKGNRHVWEKRQIDSDHIYLFGSLVTWPDSLRAIQFFFCFWFR